MQFYQQAALLQRGPVRARRGTSEVCPVEVLPLTALVVRLSSSCFGCARSLGLSYWPCGDSATDDQRVALQLSLAALPDTA